MTMTTTEFSSSCPHCGYKIEAATSFHGQKPHDGAICLCIQCGGWSFFDQFKPGGMRKPTGFEMIQLAGAPEAIKMKAAWAATKRELQWRVSHLKKQ